MRPHAQYTHGTFLPDYFADETLLDVDSARKGSVTISCKLLVSGRVPNWIDVQHVEKLLSILLQPGG